MKKIFLLVLLTGALATFNSCSKDEVRPTNKLELKFKNTGDEKIKNFVFQGISIGNISKNSTTKYYKFEPISVMNGHVNEAASIKSDYGTIESWLLSPDTENEIISNGRHTVELSLYYGCGIGFGMSLKE